MVKIMENPMNKWDDLEGFPIVLETSIYSPEFTNIDDRLEKSTMNVWRCMDPIENGEIFHCHC